MVYWVECFIEIILFYSQVIINAVSLKIFLKSLNKQICYGRTTFREFVLHTYKPKIFTFIVTSNYEARKYNGGHDQVMWFMFIYGFSPCKSQSEVKTWLPRLNFNIIYILLNFSKTSKMLNFIVFISFQSNIKKYERQVLIVWGHRQ